MWIARERDGVCWPLRMPHAYVLLIGTLSMSCAVVGFVMDASLHILNFSASPKVHISRNALVQESRYTANMENERPPHYLKQWRKHAGLTQEQVADTLDTTKGMISQLENFHLQLSPKWLRRLAPILKTQQGHIIDHDPNDLDNDIIDIWARIPERDRDRAAQVLSAFVVKTGTDD